MAYLLMYFAVANVLPLRYTSAFSYICVLMHAFTCIYVQYQMHICIYAESYIEVMQSYVFINLCVCVCKHVEVKEQL